jgi:hypothetical protein
MSTNVKLAPYSLAGEIDPSTLSPVSVSFVSRAAAPYPPGNVKINGVAFPSTTTGDAVISWNHRYRLGPYIVAQDAGDVAGGPEGTYTITIKVNNVLKHTVTGITGNSYTYTHAQRVTDDSNAAHTTTITITPVSGGISGTARSLSFVMNP